MAEALRAIISSKSAISLQRGPVDPKFQVEGVAPTNHSSSHKTRLNDLSHGIKNWTQCHNAHVWQTDGQNSHRKTTSAFHAAWLKLSEVFGQQRNGNRWKTQNSGYYAVQGHPRSSRSSHSDKCYVTLRSHFCGAHNVPTNWLTYCTTVSYSTHRMSRVLWSQSRISACHDKRVKDKCVSRRLVFVWLWRHLDRRVSVASSSHRQRRVHCRRRSLHQTPASNTDDLNTAQHSCGDRRLPSNLRQIT